ncbi:hypothetical protein Tco_1446902 [Tanacetum coccineum]
MLCTIEQYKYMKMIQKTRDKSKNNQTTTRGILYSSVNDGTLRLTPLPEHQTRELSSLCQQAPYGGENRTYTHEVTCASSKFQGIGSSNEGGKVMEYQIGNIKWDKEVSLVDGVLEGALGAIGDEIGSLGDGVFVPSWVKSTNNCFCGMMLIFGLLETLEIEALVEAMEVYGG